MGLDDLEPAFDEDEFFFEAGMREIVKDAQSPRRGLHLVGAEVGKRSASAEA